MISAFAQVNAPPSGGTCTACVLTASAVISSSCVKSGRALIDTFQLACSGWADSNLPLQFRFGFRSVADGGSIGGQGETWFSFSEEDSLDLVFGGGAFDALAMVSSVSQIRKGGED